MGGRQGLFHRSRRAALAGVVLALLLGTVARPALAATVFAEAGSQHGAAEAADPLDTPRPVGVVRPVAGGLVRAFAAPEHAYGAGHRGADLAASPGEPVRAALAGLVTFSGQVAGAGWATVDHGGGVQTTYGVLPSRQVVAGQRVDAGQVLGLLGEDAAHLDWGARVHGSYVDPLTLLGGWEAHLIHPERLLPSADPPGPGVPGAAAVGGPSPVQHGALVWPAPGRTSSPFGTRTHPVTGQRRLHAGVDIAAATGTPIVAAAAGVVRAAGLRGGYGNLVVVDHGGGLETRYAHASAIAVAAGERVEAGRLLAWVGSTGLSTGPHLHFEVRVGGDPRDPLGFFPG
ncbi:MAG: peptidoglycan DD-metalloendopeptidase family protein [Nitriliruptorales bacterium]|nr:peptidoglycan DD-metalloendopeptidase family protein [Nitriliruptorales bacterium]